MSSVPAGQRNWKCPECGSDVLLSITQLDPIACESCVAKLKGGGTSGKTQSVATAVAGPLGIWSSLPDMTKLAIAGGALIVGLLVGYVAGKSTVKEASTSHRSTTHSKESSSNKEPSTKKDSADDEDTSVSDEKENRPEAPGPGYKWVRGRKHKDGTYGEGHWAKDPHYKGKD